MSLSSYLPMPKREIEADLYTDLTEQQERVLDYIEARSEDGLPPPTRTEIARHLGFRSPYAADEHLRALERKGWIKLIPGIARGITLVEP